jgi:hypothetical protein
MKTLNPKTIIPIAVVIILFPLGYSIVASVFSLGAPSSEPFLQKVDPEHGDTCVLETKFPDMDPRFFHMDVLKRVRDDAMREGKRGGVSFNDCRECHTQREHFCDRCHHAVNLNLDRSCFRCHYYPSSEESTTNLGEPTDE